MVFWCWFELKVVLDWWDLRIRSPLGYMTHVLLRSGIPKLLLCFLSKGMEQRPYFRRNMGSMSSCSNSGHDLNVTDPIRRLCADDIP